MFFLKRYKIINLKKGQVMLLTSVFFMAFTLILSFGLTNPIIKQAKIAINLWKMKEGYYLAESGLEDIVYRVKNNMSFGVSEVLIINGYEINTDMVDSLGGKILRTTSNLGGYIKKIEVEIKKGSGVSFVYGVQVGQGGFYMSGSAGIIGNVFSSGEIVGGSSSYITGSAVSTNGSGVNLEQENSTPASPSNSVIFGKTTSEQDFAQSFKMSSSVNITKINLYLKKIGSPANLTLRLVKNSGGIPGSSPDDIISSIPVPASITDMNYGWIEIPLPTNSYVLANTTYWILLDASKDSNNYYSLGANADSSYVDGLSKIGEYKKTWSNTGYDGYFKIFTGGSLGKISGLSEDDRLKIGTDGVGGAYAHTVSYTEVGGDIKCQEDIFNNKSCDTSYPDPYPKIMPVSEANIEGWKNTATAGGVINGDYTMSGSDIASLGPRKIVGDLTLNNSAILTLTGTLYITGDIKIRNSGQIKLSSSYEGNSGVLVSDGKISIENSAKIFGSGQDGSYLLMVTTSDCPNGSSCGGEKAVEVGGSAGAVILNAQNGTINFSGSAKANEATANKITMSGSTILTYESGVAHTSFVDGPSGGFNIVSWKELEN